MARISLSFDERFRETMLNSTKLVTTRPEKKGEAGDIFEAFGKEFVLARVVEKELVDCVLDYEIEGFGFMSSFVRFWQDTYGWWEAERPVYQHWFLPYED